MDSQLAERWKPYLDNAKKLLSGKPLAADLSPGNPVFPDDVYNMIRQNATWCSLNGRKGFFSREKGVVQVISGAALSGLDATKKSCCVIQGAMCYGVSGNKLRINGVVIDFPAAVHTGNKPEWETLVAELPAGTAELNISVDCVPKSVFAIKSILVYQ